MASLKVLLTESIWLRIPYQPTTTVGEIRHKIVHRTTIMQLGPWQSMTRSLEHFHVVDSQEGTFLFDEDTMEDIGVITEWRVVSSAKQLPDPAQATTAPIANAPPAPIAPPQRGKDDEESLRREALGVILSEKLAKELDSEEDLERRLILDNEKQEWRALDTVVSKNISAKWRAALMAVRIECVDHMITGEVEQDRLDARALLDSLNETLEDVTAGPGRFMDQVERYNARFGLRGGKAAAPVAVPTEGLRKEDLARQEILQGLRQALDAIQNQLRIEEDDWLEAEALTVRAKSALGRPGFGSALELESQKELLSRCRDFISEVTKRNSVHGRKRY